MEKIRRLRVIPPRYTKVNAEIGDIISGSSASGVFMNLYRLFGKPFDSESVFRYVLKYQDVVVDLSSDGKSIDASVYIPPYMKQIADKKRVKMINVIAREVNGRDKIFFPFEKMYDGLFFIVRRKNDLLYERYVREHGDSKESLDNLRRESVDAIGEVAMKRINSDDIEYLPEVNGIVKDLLNRIDG